MSMSLDSIASRQREFQKLCGIPIDHPDYSIKVKLSEIYILKLIEEAVELRKTIPSTMNPWSKNQPDFSRERILEEMADIELFLINFKLVWDIYPDEMLSALESVQDNNFKLLREKIAKRGEEGL